MELKTPGSIPTTIGAQADDGRLEGSRILYPHRPRAAGFNHRRPSDRRDRQRHRQVPQENGCLKCTTVITGTASDAAPRMANTITNIELSIGSWCLHCREGFVWCGCGDTAVQHTFLGHLRQRNGPLTGKRFSIVALEERHGEETRLR